MAAMATEYIMILSNIGEKDRVEEKLAAINRYILKNPLSNCSRFD